MPEKYAIDCEMVESYRRSILARVSIVDYNERCVYDTFVRPTDPVTDFRGFITGITPEHLRRGKNISTVQFEVANIIRGNILIGHSLHFDFAVLGLYHPDTHIRDLAKYEPFLKRNKGQPISLKRLALEYLETHIQLATHCSIEDAKASMRIYKKVEYQWENVTSWWSILLKTTAALFSLIIVIDIIKEFNKK